MARTLAIACQLLLLVYHQITTLVHLHPFNGVKSASGPERWVEAGVNAVLMGLGPMGFLWRIPALMTFGVIYYFVLLFVEIVIWWVPYFSVPSGRWREIYNRLLAVATSSFDGGDTLAKWVAIHDRLHAGTITVLPRRPGRITPNLEHLILHAWTVVTAVVTACAYVGHG